jgi:hypothetical protein
MVGRRWRVSWRTGHRVRVRRIRAARRHGRPALAGLVADRSPGSGPADPCRAAAWSAGAGGVRSGPVTGFGSGGSVPRGGMVGRRWRVWWRTGHRVRVRRIRAARRHGRPALAGLVADRSPGSGPADPCRAAAWSAGRGLLVVSQTPVDSAALKQLRRGSNENSPDDIPGSLPAVCLRTLPSRYLRQGGSGTELSLS